MDVLNITPHHSCDPTHWTGFCEDQLVLIQVREFSETTPPSISPLEASLDTPRTARHWKLGYDCECELCDAQIDQEEDFIWDPNCIMYKMRKTSVNPEDLGNFLRLVQMENNTLMQTMQKNPSLVLRASLAGYRLRDMCTSSFSSPSPSCSFSSSSSPKILVSSGSNHSPKTKLLREFLVGEALLMAATLVKIQRDCSKDTKVSNMFYHAIKYGWIDGKSLAFRLCLEEALLMMKSHQKTTQM